jgi:hypothetical protein
MLVFALSPLNGQGVTSSALEGGVASTDGMPVAHAIVRVTAVPSGTYWQVVTDAGGRYFVENLQVGGPYIVEVKRLGFVPARRTDLLLALGQRRRADFVLLPAALTLAPVTVTAGSDPLLNSGRTGPTHIVSQSEIAALPNQTRDISLLASLGALTMARPLGGSSIGGQNQGYNSFQLDGGMHADLYLGRTPGGASPSGALPEVQPHAISLETIRELQVQAAPFDVRLGNFAGGVLTAVTKSGTNEVHGSFFSYLQNGRLVASNAAGDRSEFTSGQFGGTLSGPIVRDRVHFLVSADLQRRMVPDPGPFVTDTPRVTKVSHASALRFQRILRESYGLDAGSLGPTDGQLPAQELFGKISMQLGDAGHLELSHRFAHADRRDFIDVGVRADTTAFSSVAGWSISTANTSRLIWGTLVGRRAQNEAIISYQHLRDDCVPNGSLPRIQVGADGGSLVAGPNSVCPTTAVNQSALGITDNLTFGAGAHLLTLGSHGELLHFRDPLVQASAGRWIFANLDSLAVGHASHYDRGLPSSSRTPGADFGAVMLGLYAQDRWAATSRLTLTAGLRVDIPFLRNNVPTNVTLLAAQGIDTGVLPTGNAEWSPRLGVNYDVSGDATTFLRGGIGLFGGPPPYRWLGNAYRESGDESVVTCDASARAPALVPPFSGNTQPSTCANGKGATPRISFFEPGFVFPQNLKIALGTDRRLPWDAVMAIDLLYTRAVHQIYVNDANLDAPSRFAVGEGGRPQYGEIDPTSAAHPQWRDTSFGEIYRLSDHGGDRAFAMSVQVTKPFGARFALDISYAYSRVSDRMSLVNFPARANFSNTPVDGTLDDRHLRSSFFETRHKLSIVTSTTLPFGTRLSLLYQGATQSPYTYVVSGDVNADGIGGPGSLPNDVVYVPRTSAPGGDISLVVLSAGRFVPAPASSYDSLDAFIEGQQCLREHRGRLMSRGSCMNGWLDLLSARLMKTVPVAGSQQLEMSADVFNVPNLIRARWGRRIDTTTDPAVPLLRLRGWDPAAARGVYQLSLPARNVAEDAASRWRVQLGARYIF